jgi:D-tyrosyl-tRNA(Tyr) deacylase
MVLKVFKAFSDSQSKKKCAAFFIWAKIAKEITKHEFETKEREKKAIMEKKNAEQLVVFERNVNEQKQSMIKKQVESLLFSVSIDSMNGFLNL